MSVSECKIIRTGRSVSETQSKRTYSLTYQVKAEQGDWQPIVLEQARTTGPNPLPRINDVWNLGSVDPSAICTKVELNQTEEGDTGIWIGTVEFGEPEDGKTPEDEDENPIKRPTKWTTVTRSELIAVAEDKDGEPLRNAAGDEFIDPIQIEDDFPVLQATKNIASLQQIINWNLEYRKSVNSVAFRGAAVRQVKFVPIRVGEQVFENNVTYYPATFQFEFDPETWDEKIVNQGYYYLDGTDRKRAKDDDDFDSVSPVLLTAAGAQLPQGQIGNLLEFRVRPEKDFNNLVKEAGLDK